MEMMSELSSIEAEAFKDFCVKANVKNVQEYEQTRLQQD